MLEWYRRRSLLARRLLAILGTLAIVGSILWFTPTGLYVTAPGAAIRTEFMVEVAGGEDHPGRLMLLVVAAQPANLFWYLYAKVDKRADLETPRQFLGGVPDFGEYVKLSQAMMVDSQRTARAIALQVVGRGSGVTSNGVAIVGVRSTAPAAAVLRAGDVVVAMNGAPVTGVNDLRTQMQSVQPNEAVRTTVLREGKRLELDIPTYEDPDRKGSAIIGATIKTEYQFDIPIDVTIKSGQITGPSAGLMFALTIIDKLTPGGITGGISLAGTGTIQPDGSIGAVGGVRQKTFTAEAAGAQVLFVPRENHEEARSAATRVQVVSVATIYDALDWLKEQAPRR